MKRPNFNVNGDMSNEQLAKNFGCNIDKLAEAVGKYVFTQKENLFKAAVHEIEGRLPTDEEIVKHGMKVMNDSKPGEELITWKGKPILWTGQWTWQANEQGAKFPFVPFRFLYTPEEPK